jgi:type III restriction enzyme
MELKKYQDKTLGVLRHFFEEARIHGAKVAYEATTREEEQAKRLRGWGGTYAPLLGQEDMPYICLRLPTGGGKTLLAAHAVKIAADAWMDTAAPLVLWLVPTTTIRKQTVEALNNPRHPYRQALSDAFGEPVRILDIGEFTRLQAHDLGRHPCIFVGTIQALRVENTEGRKVFAHHEALEPMFAKVPRRMPDMETLGTELAAKIGGDPDDIRFSFANLMHLHRPLMIVDEAHKAVTGLSRDMQRRVNPCAIVEFTATPAKKSNILHSVHAMELKAEEMIKLPVVLAEHKTWESAVTGAIQKRAELADEAARDTAGYIRPILLLQAEDRNREVTVEVLKQHLIDVHHIDPRKIAIATGDQRELDGINLFDPNADPLIDYVITVEALKEGWDCSFAYVFCSVANIKSATDAEQLLGRVLRMPYATRRRSPMLNKAYAHLVSKSFSEAANALKDRLVTMGFDEQEAEANIEAQPGFGDDETDGLWGARQRPKPSTQIALDASPHALMQMSSAAPGKITVERQDGGAPVVRVTGFLRETEIARAAEALPVEAASLFREQVAKFHAEHAHGASAAERGEEFVVPALMSWVQGDLVFADTDRFTEYFDWALNEQSAQLARSEFDVEETSEGFEIDLDGERLAVRKADDSDQLLLDIPVDGWTPSGLVQLLFRQVRANDIPASSMLAWLTQVVAFLTGPRQIPLAALMRCRFLLARRLNDRIKAQRDAARDSAYQSCLFAPEARVELSFDEGFRFADGMFDGTPLYRGTYRFARHFLGSDHVPAFENDKEGEEFKAAQLIDAMTELDYWVRNVSNHPNAFRLPVASGWTYPDFVGRLKDGRLLVVEYKGSHLIAEAAEKRAVGELWQRHSNGAGIYVFAIKDDDGRDVRQQIRQKIAIS